MKRRRRKSSFGRKILWLFLLLLIFSSVRTWYMQEQESRSLAREEEQVQDRINELEKEIQRLRGTLENITDDAYIESIARKNLKMVREDEWVLVDIQHGKD